MMHNEKHHLNLFKSFQRVVSLLIDFPEARDNDRFLISKYWEKELEGKENTDVLQALRNGEITIPESIRRSRQKAQELHKNLRGRLWDARHNIEGLICEQLTFFDKW